MNFVTVFQFLPLGIFLLTYRISTFFWPTCSNSCPWRTAFIVGGIAALLQTAIFLYKRYELNPLILAVNCFLLCNSIGIIFDIKIILEFYRNFMQTTLLIWLLIIGVITTCFSKKGFIGITHAKHSKIIKYSLILIGVAGLAVAWSFYFKNNLLLSAFVPFISVVLLRSYLISVLLKSEKK